MARHLALENTTLKLKDCSSYPRMRIQPPQIPNDLRFQIEIKYETVTRTGRDVVNATLEVLSWFARVGVPVQTSGRPSAIEPAKGGLAIIGDPERMWDHEVGCLVCVCVRARVYAHRCAKIRIRAHEFWGVTVVAWSPTVFTRSLHDPHNNRS